MRYKLFIFDLDETLWTVSEGLCSLVRPPYTLVNPDRVETREGFWVELKPGARDLLKFLKKNDCYISLASRNDAKSVAELIEAFQLTDCFDFPQVGWRPKEDSVRRIIKAIQKRDKVTIKLDQVFFLDDWPENVIPVRHMGATALIYGQDVESYRDLMDMLK